jgi:hypothetical protein
MTLSDFALREIYNGLELPSAEAIQAMHEEIAQKDPKMPYSDDPKLLAEAVLKLRGFWG